MPDEDFYAAFARVGDEDRFISHGPKSGRISLKVTPRRLFVLLEGEPEGRTLTACFREALAGGQDKMDVPAVVDMTRYYGQVDWSSIRAIRDMAPWKTPLTAYVVRPHTMFDMIIKIVGTIFVQAQHRAFTSHSEALSWLEMAQASSG